MKKNILFLFFLAVTCIKAQVCNTTGNIMLFTNYDGGTLTVNVNQNIPNLKIGVCSYEACRIVLTGAFVGNVTEVRYAGYNSPNNSNCASPVIPTTTIIGAPVGATTSITFAPPSTISNTNGYSSIICAYSCNNNTSQGGCNTVDQVEAYFLGVFSGNTLFAHHVQYGCWTGTFSVSSGGTCCPPPVISPGQIGTSSTTLCSGTSATINSIVSATVSSGTISYQWQSSTTSSLSGFSNIPGATSPTYTAPGLTSTAYYRRMASTSATNTAFSNVLTLSVTPLPMLSINGPTAVCLGQSATLTASGGNTYSWSANNSSGISVVIFPTVGIVMSITCWPAASNCSVTSNWSISVNPLPNVFAGNSPVVICPGQSATFTASGAQTYTWQPGNLTGSTQTILGTTSTNYTITGTDANGCSNSNYLAVQTNPTPTILTSGNTTLCSGQSLTLGATGALSYTWEPGAWIGTTRTVSPVSSVVYTINATDGDGCPGSAVHAVTVVPAPTITVSADRISICAGENTRLVASGGNSYSWPASVTQATANTATVTPASTTVFSTTGTDSNGCSALASITISVSACLGFSGDNEPSTALTIYPNPNNGNFYIASEEPLELNLYNSSGHFLIRIKLNGANSFSFQLTNLEAGVYFIKANKPNIPFKKVLVID